MATGPEHYRAAESSLAEIARRSAERDGQEMTSAQAYELHASIANGIAAAQAHATLALTAATVANIRRNGAADVDIRTWNEVLEP